MLTVQHRLIAISTNATTGRTVMEAFMIPEWWKIISAGLFPVGLVATSRAFTPASSRRPRRKKIADGPCLYGHV